jgi:hypothetical protein
MIKVYKESKRMTPNQLAKYIVADVVDRAFYWFECNDDDIYNNMTTKEREQVEYFLHKHVSRVEKLLDLDKMRKMVFNRD